MPLRALQLLRELRDGSSPGSGQLDRAQPQDRGVGPGPVDPLGASSGKW